MGRIHIGMFDAHLANSAYTAAELREAMTAPHLRPVYVTPMGVDLPEIPDAARRRELRNACRRAAGIPLEAPVVLYAGRLSPEKQVGSLVPVAARLAHHGGCLVVAGDGPVRAALAAECAQHAPGVARFVGHLDRAALHEWLLAADLFVHPNLREPFGIGPLEAMAVGLPVVLPRAGGVLTHATDENAWLVPDSPLALVAGVEAALRDRGRAAARAEAGRQTAAAFAWPARASGMLARYRQIHDTRIAGYPTGLSALARGHPDVIGRLPARHASVTARRYPAAAPRCFARQTGGRSMKTLVMAVAAVLAIVPVLPATPTLTLSPLGTVKTGLFRSEDPRSAEINAFDPAASRIYVVSPEAGGLDVIDASDPAAPFGAAFVDLVAACQAALAGCPLSPGGEPNSVAIHGAVMAVAIANAVRTDPGYALFFRLQGSLAPEPIAVVEVGAGPDMVTFTADGRYALTANEGEPNQSYTVDPRGSISVIEIGRDGRPRRVRHAGFERFDSPGQRAKLERDGVRIFGPGASVSQDLEPEYIAVSGNIAYVTLQENNALAIVNIPGAVVQRIVGLGTKDHSLAMNALDASDRDGVNIRTWPVHGLYQPDGIHAFTAEGSTFLITANEGDARDYDGYAEELRLGSPAYVLDPLVFPDWAALEENTALGRLTVSTASGDENGDGLFERIHSFGARSVSIFDQKGRRVWDSGNMFERLSEMNDGTLSLFNTTSTANSRDNRSDDKGVEPESVVVGQVGGRTYAFVGLERDGGIVVLDVSRPAAPAFVTYVTNRKFPRDPATGELLACSDTTDCGDLGPEGLSFVPAAQSPTGTALLIVSNEVSSTTTIWRVE